MPKITDFTTAIYRSAKAIAEFVVQNRKVIIALAEFGAAALIAVKAYRAFSKMNAAVGTWKVLKATIGGLSPAGLLAAAAIGTLAVVFADATAKGLTLNEALEDLMANMTGLGNPNLRGKEAQKFDDHLDSVGKELDAMEKRRLGATNEKSPAEKPKAKTEQEEIIAAGDKASEQARADAARAKEFEEASARKIADLERQPMKPKKRLSESATRPARSAVLRSRTKNKWQLPGSAGQRRMLNDHYKQRPLKSAATNRQPPTSRAPTPKPRRALN
jgi:hypothetical protein